MISTMRRDDDGDAGKHEVTADGAQRRGAPGEQRADAGEEEQEDADGHSHAVIEGRAHGDLRALNEFGEHGEERSPENREAGGQKDEVVEEERALARDQRLEMVLVLAGDRGCRGR